MGNRRVALKPHAAKIRRWVEEGRNDDWIAQELNTTPSSVQSFRSRNSIYRRDPVRRGQLGAPRHTGSGGRGHLAQD